MTKNSRIVLLDVGGTFVKSSLGISGKGAVEGTFMTIPISSDGTAEEITAAFREAVSGQIRRAEEEGYAIDAVCAAIPGPFNYKEGIFLTSVGVYRNSLLCTFNKYTVCCHDTGLDESPSDVHYYISVT